VVLARQEVLLLLVPLSVYLVQLVHMHLLDLQHAHRVMQALTLQQQGVVLVQVAAQVLTPWPLLPLAPIALQVRFSQIVVKTFALLAVLDTWQLLQA